MFKKLAIAAAGTALILGTVTPVLAYGRHHRSQDTLEIENENTVVTNTVTTSTDTGYNSTGTGSRRHGRGGSVETGDAWSGVGVVNDVNFTTVDSCGCFDEVEIENEDTTVSNVVTTSSNTGHNTARRGSVTTGDAGSEVLVTNYVNTTVVGGSAE